MVTFLMGFPCPPANPALWQLCYHCMDSSQEPWCSSAKKTCCFAPRASAVLGAVLLNPHCWHRVCPALFTAKLSTAATSAKSLSWKTTFQPPLSKALSAKVISGLADAVITARRLLLCDIFQFVLYCLCRIRWFSIFTIRIVAPKSSR